MTTDPATTHDALVRCLESSSYSPPDEPFTAANVVDALYAIAKALHHVAHALERNPE